MGMTQENSEWKSVDIELPKDNPAETQQVAPVVQNASPPVPVDLPQAVDLASIMPAKPANDPSALVELVEIRGKSDDIQKFKDICATHFPEGSPGAVITTCGLPLGTVQSLVAEAQKINPKMDFTKDKLVVNVRIKRNCNKCNGNGYMGRLANVSWTPTNNQPKFHQYRLKCTCLKLQLELETPETKNPEQKDASDAPEGKEQGHTP